MVENQLVLSEDLQGSWNSHQVCRKLWHQIMAISEHTPLFRTLVSADLSFQPPLYCMLSIKGARPGLVATWGTVSTNTMMTHIAAKLGSVEGSPGLNFFWAQRIMFDSFSG